MSTTHSSLRYPSVTGLSADMVIGVTEVIFAISLGALLVLFGLSFLYEWSYAAWSNFSRLEYVVILLILIIIATLGYLQGVGAGIVAAVVLFAINYGRVSVTKPAFSGAEIQSRFTRSPYQRKALIEHGEKTFVLQLQGLHLFRHSQ